MKALWPLLFTAALVGWPCSSEALSSYPDRFDHDIQRAAAHYWPDLPVWKLWKSQLIAESNLDPTVCSAAGACGLAQFMPGSWNDMLKHIGADPGASRFDARLAIEAGAFFMASLRHQWAAERPQLERHWLAAASYNRGLGNILQDQAECRDARLWSGITPCTLKHTTETPAYVDRINRIWKQLETE